MLSLLLSHLVKRFKTLRTPSLVSTQEMIFLGTLFFHPYPLISPPPLEEEHESKCVVITFETHTNQLKQKLDVKYNSENNLGGSIHAVYCGSKCLNKGVDQDSQLKGNKKSFAGDET